jgi:hypothetical protein
MISERDITKASLDSIYSEIIQMSCAIGECKASIEHTSDLVIRSNEDLRNILLGVNSRIVELEKQENIRQRKSKFLWDLISLSPGNILKWLLLIICLSAFAGSAMKFNINDKIYQLLQYATE